MRFKQVIGHSENPKTKELIERAQQKLSAAFTELSLSYENKAFGSNLGGDPLVFQLVYSLPHYCDISAIQYDEINEKLKTLKEKNESLSKDEEELSEDLKRYKRKMGKRVLRTAATDGARFYWNPEFVCSLSQIGLRIVLGHESTHSIYMHPARRGSRLHNLFNIACDFKVNWLQMEDLKTRQIRDYPKVFEKELGEYILLDEYTAFLKNPFEPPARLAHLNPMNALKKMADPAYKDPADDKEPMYFADPNIPADMKRPENIYDLLYKQIPKCPKCGKLGKYKKPEEYKELEKQIKAKQEKEEKDKKECKDHSACKHKHNEKEHKHSEEKEHKHKEHKKNQQASQPGDKEPEATTDGEAKGEEKGEGEQSSSGACNEEGSCDPSGGCGSCSECEGEDSVYVDPFGVGDTLDDHIDSDVSEEELAKRMHDAIEVAKKMAGKIPGDLEGELGMLTAPKLSVWDFIRSKFIKYKAGDGKSDWLRPKSRPMFAGLYVPRKKTYDFEFLCGVDTSGSMSPEDMAFGVSQLQSIDDKASGMICSWDSRAYFENMIKLNKCTKEVLATFKPIGRGGTCVSDFVNRYEDFCPKIKMLIIVTDGFLYDNELTQCKVPPKDVDIIWIVTAHNPSFLPKFGRVFHLHGENL